jgi:hypothetical protein
VLVPIPTFPEEELKIEELVKLEELSYLEM